MNSKAISMNNKAVAALPKHLLQFAVDQRYDRRDLAVTTDFRNVFAEVVVRHLGVADPAPIFPGHTIKAANFPGLLS